MLFECIALVNKFYSLFSIKRTFEIDLIGGKKEQFMPFFKKDLKKLKQNYQSHV